MAIIEGSNIADLLAGGPDADEITGFPGSDTIFGGRNNDNLNGGEDNDLIFGDLNSDSISGGAGNDTLTGGTGNPSNNNLDEADLLQGNQGDDWLFGNLGSDTLEGGQGNDTLFGGKQTDVLNGGDGDDVIYGDLAVSDDVTNFTRTDYPANDRPYEMAAADFDGDGDKDLVVSNSGFDSAVAGKFEGNSISILRNNGNGTFAAPVSITTGIGPTALPADLDGDGDSDLAVSHAEEDTISILLNDGTGNFTASTPLATGDRPKLSKIADLDGDGDLDLLSVDTVRLNLNTANESGNSLSFHRNNGNGSFAAAETVVVGEGVFEVNTADLDGDGDLDLMTPNQAEDTISILFNNGGGVFASPVKLSVGSRPISTVGADLDGDGDRDLAVANFGNFGSSASLSVFLNNGNGTFGQETRFNSTRFPSRLRSVDLDGDGDLDLAMLNSVFTVGTGASSGNAISVLRNNGDGTFAEPENLRVGNVPLGLVIDNLDGIRNVDLATANFDNDNVTLYLNQALVTQGDTLTGGAGADDFVFNQLGAEGDTITDFQPGVDQILLSATGFGLTPGAISADQFVLGSAALDSSDRFLYNVGTGILFFDPDGTGVATPSVLAALTGAPSLTAADLGAV
jgi:FG-GAP-like repeat/RTX calcium-binding nonapeptide repeat (4 copies)